MEKLTNFINTHKAHIITSLIIMFLISSVFIPPYGVYTLFILASFAMYLFIYMVVSTWLER